MQEKRTPEQAEAALSAAQAEDRERALALTPVSRETLADLDRYAALLCAWQHRVNLVAASSIPQLWTRHIADSLQLLPLLPKEADLVIDLGSGAGFPGLPLACAVKPKTRPFCHLVEATGKKAAFLREAIAVTQAPAAVYAGRIEDAASQLAGPATVVTARALAPLPRLLALAEPFFAAGGQGLFPKGKGTDAELTAARESWMLDIELHPSRTDPSGRVLLVRRAERRARRSPRQRNPLLN